MPLKRGGHHISVRFNDAESKTIDLNSDLVWSNHYTKMYPTGVELIIEKEIILQTSFKDNSPQMRTISPLDQGIVFYKIIIDRGGYEKTYLKTQESS